MSDAFSRRYRDHIPDVYGYFAYRLGSRAEAERLTQATFERAFRERTRFGSDRTETSVRLLTIARETGRGAESVDGSDGDDLGIETDLAAALERLERLERAVIALRYGAGLARARRSPASSASARIGFAARSRAAFGACGPSWSPAAAAGSDPTEGRSVPAGAPAATMRAATTSSASPRARQTAVPEPPPTAAEGRGRS